MAPLHIQAEQGAVAPAALLPGDPDRAAFIAETYLSDVTQYNAYRHLFGYTGSYRGKRVSVQATGMGCPSTAIVVEELIMLGVTTLVRVGTTGIIDARIAPGELIVATAAVPNEGTSRQYLGGDPPAPCASLELAQELVSAASRQQRRVHVGLIQTDDGFYALTKDAVPRLRQRGVLSVEMEASALFTLAQLRGVRGGCVLTASNYVGDESFVEPHILREGVKAMAEVALEAVTSLETQ